MNNESALSYFKDKEQENMAIKQYLKDGISYQFNFENFKRLFLDMSKQYDGVGNYEMELAESIGVSKDTVHAWRNRKNAPSDIEKVEDLAKVLNVHINSLLFEIESSRENEVDTMSAGNMMNNISRRRVLLGSEKAAVRRIYLELLNYLRKKEAYFQDLVAWDEGWWKEVCIDDNEDATDEVTMLTWEYENYSQYFEDFSSEHDDYYLDLDKVKESLVEELVDMPGFIYGAFEKLIEKYSLELSRSFWTEKHYEAMKHVLVVNGMEDTDESRKRILEDDDLSEAYYVKNHWLLYETARADTSELVEIVRGLLGK